MTFRCILIAAILASTSSLPTLRKQPGPSGRKVILFLVDGFRWDFPDMPGLTGFPRIQKMGVKARYLIPEFPTNTWPNHYTIDTGLHPESHGVLDNYMYDPETERTFSFRNAYYDDPTWWNGAEPFWITAKKQGIRTHLFHWIGCPITIRNLTADHCVPYPKHRWVEHEPFVERMYESLDLIENDQTDLVGLYTDLVDHYGHRYDVYSAAQNQTIRQVDGALNQLVDELETRNLTETVDVIVVSDHGMSNTARERLIYLVDYISYWKWFTTDMETVRPSCALTFIWPKRKQQIATIYGLLVNKHPHMRVFLQQHYSDVPNWHFANNKRTPPILLVADPGWCIVRPFDFFISDGTHGYDNNEEEMRTIFMAFGPDFKKDYIAKPFNVADVYQIYTRIIGMRQQPHNGTWSHVSDMMTWDNGRH